MNATGGGGMFDAPSLGGIGYGISVFVGILFLITTITLASYFCTRIYQPPPAPPPPPHGAGDGTADVDVEAHPAAESETGIDEATLKGYPKLVYSQSSSPSDQAAAAVDDASCCPICLAEYKDGEVLRLLPECKHLFHLQCVDPWLRRHPTCPVCRTSPLPSPLPTPLAEVVPLATTRRQYSR